MENSYQKNQKLTKCFRNHNTFRGTGQSIPLPPQGPNRSSEWIKLLSYGSHLQNNHSLKFLKTNADTYVPQFNTMRSRAARLFKGLYVMDETKQPIGTIKKMQVRPQGVWAIIHWHQAGRKLLYEAPALFFTPTWKVFEPEESPGALVPLKLLEIILTKEPYPYTTKPKPKRKRTLNYESITNHLLGEKHPIQDSRKQFMALVYNHMHKSGQDFSSSWSYIKQNNPQLYENSF